MSHIFYDGRDKLLSSLSQEAIMSRIAEKQSIFELGISLAYVIKMESIREDLASEGLSPTKLLILILYAIALALGVAIVVLPMVGQPVDQSLPGIALLCLAFAGLLQVTK